MSNEKWSRRTFIRSSAALSAGMALPGARHAAGQDAPRHRGVLPGKEVPWLEAVQTHDLPADAPSPPPLLVDADGQSITTLAAWKEKRARIRTRWLDYLGGPITSDFHSTKLTVLEEDRPTGVVRQLVEYENEPGETVRGYLIKPQHVTEPRPGVLVLHSTTPDTIRRPVGLSERWPGAPFGLRLAQMGCVTFSPKNFMWRGPFDELLSDFHTQYPDSTMNWGAKSDLFARVTEQMHERHPGVKGMAKMVFDAQRGLDVLEDLESVDSERLGAIGHSLGAMEMLYVMAFEERIQAAVGNEAGISSSFTDINWEDPWFLTEAIHDFAYDHYELLGLAAPRAYLIMGGGNYDGLRSWPYIKTALPVYDLYDQPRRMGLFLHGTGHNVPPVAEYRAYQWLLTYL